MSGYWIDVVLALATMLILARGLRQVPTYNDGRRELRGISIWAVGGGLAIWFAVQIALGLVLGFALAMTMGDRMLTTDPSQLLQEQLNEVIIVGQVIGLLAVLVATNIGQRAFRRQSALDLGLRPYHGWLLDVIFGLVLGFIGFFLLFLVGSVTGQVEVVSHNDVGPVLFQGLFTSLAVFITVALGEELLIRGYVLQNLELGWGTVGAAVASSFLWGFLHFSNPGATLAAVVNIAAAGLVYAYAYLITRSLWLPIALHLSWNFSQGSLFGFTVSGLATPGIMRLELIGPESVTGGAFGPEAGLIIIPVLVLQIIALRWWLNVRPALGISCSE